MKTLLRNGGQLSPRLRTFRQGRPVQHPSRARRNRHGQPHPEWKHLTDKHAAATQRKPRIIFARSLTRDFTFPKSFLFHRPEISSSPSMRRGNPAARAPLLPLAASSRWLRGSGTQKLHGCWHPAAPLLQLMN
jgi:hypothetical protein